ncbi:LysE family translocator [Nocardioides sp. YJ-D4]
MPSLNQFAAFALASFVFILIPGPSVLFALGRALTAGRRDAVLSVGGNASGQFIQVLAVAIGLGALVAASATAFTVVKLVGAAYVVYLGIQAIRHRGDARAALDGGEVARVSGWGAVRTGIIVGATNPKTIVFHLAFLPQFIDTSAPAVPQILLLGAIFSAMAFACDSGWVFAASRAKAWFARKPKRLDGLGAGGGVVMIGLGATLATASHGA